MQEKREREASADLSRYYGDVPKSTNTGTRHPIYLLTLYSTEYEVLGNLVHLGTCILLVFYIYWKFILVSASAHYRVRTWNTQDTQRQRKHNLGFSFFGVRTSSPEWQFGSERCKQLGLSSIDKKKEHIRSDLVTFAFVKNWRQITWKLFLNFFDARLEVQSTEVHKILRPGAEYGCGCQAASSCVAQQHSRYQLDFKVNDKSWRQGCFGYVREKSIQVWQKM